MPVFVLLVRSEIVPIVRDCAGENRFLMSVCFVCITGECLFRGFVYSTGGVCYSRCGSWCDWRDEHSGITKKFRSCLLNFHTKIQTLVFGWVCFYEKAILVRYFFSKLVEAIFEKRSFFFILDNLSQITYFFYNLIAILWVCPSTDQTVPLSTLLWALSFNFNAYNVHMYISSLDMHELEISSYKMSRLNGHFE